VSSGHLAFAAGALRAVPFDLARLETRGTPVTVVPDVVTTIKSGVDAVVAGDGTLASVSGSAEGMPRTLVWVDRQGRETPIPAPPRPYLLPALSHESSDCRDHRRPPNKPMKLAGYAGTCRQGWTDRPIMTGEG
jgi:hypothetical protein